MILLKKMSVIVFCLLCICCPLRVAGEDDLYRLSDLGVTVAEFASFHEANSYFDSHADEHENLLLWHGDKLIRMEYGIIEFRKDQACSLLIDYHSEQRETDDVFNPCFAADAAYLSTSRDGKTVRFRLAGDTGSTSIDDVILHPYEDLPMEPSTYANVDGILIHKIRTQFERDYYSFSLSLDDAPEQLQKGRDYYSYDGHYFYDDLKKMTDDYRDGSAALAVNEQAYYDYYVYLPYRSRSVHSLAEVEDHFNDTLKMNGRLVRYLDRDGDNATDEINRSQLYGQLDQFFCCQYLYGTNGMMLLASAISESSYGRSPSAFFSNNLYQTAAFDTEQEKNASRYDRVANSIYAYSKYIISSLSSNHLRRDYAGTHFGDRAGGIAANYSLDPYYGEKNGSVYYELDKQLGSQDRNAYAIGIIKDQDRVGFYSDSRLEDLLYSLDHVSELAFVILEESEEAYKIQIDDSFDENYLYDPETSTAYVRKELFGSLINADKMAESTYETVRYDLNGGHFHDLDELQIHYREGDERLEFVPEKESQVFTGYTEDLVADYKEIEDIALIAYEDRFVSGFPDLSGWKLRISYADGSNDTLPVTTDMLRMERVDDGGVTVHIAYAGLTIDQRLEGLEDALRANEALRMALEKMDAAEIKENIAKSDITLSFAQIRSIDHELRKTNERNYVIKDDDDRHDLSISGLDLSLADKHTFGFVADTYYVITGKIPTLDEKKITELASGYGFEEVEGLKIAFRFNYQDIPLEGPAVVQIALADMKNDKIYSVYHLDSNGDIVKCRTTPSDNYIQFLIDEAGSYEVLSLPSVNEYYIDDTIEDLSADNMGFDNHQRNFLLMGVIFLSIAGLIGITVYYIVYHKRRRAWRDFRRSLQKAGFAQEEKPKS